MNLNKAILAGRVVRDPETKSLPNGQQVSNFSLVMIDFIMIKMDKDSNNPNFITLFFLEKQLKLPHNILKKVL